MANSKISAMGAVTTLASGDLVPLVQIAGPTNKVITPPNLAAALAAVLTPYTSFASGTPATIPATASIAQLTFGTTSPGITIANAGTYLIRAFATIEFVGATFAASQLVTLKLRRTNNTAADLTNGTQTVITGIQTTATGTLAVVCIETEYIASAGDIVQLWGGVATSPSAGALEAVAAQIIAQRIA